MMRGILYLGLIGVLAACSGPRATHYEGETISRAARDLGPPARVLELAEGQRAYEWDIQQTEQAGPLRVQGVNIGIGVGSRSGAGLGVELGRDTVITGTCTYTLYTQQQEDRWVVTDVSDEGRTCF